MKENNVKKILILWCNRLFSNRYETIIPVKTRESYTQTDFFTDLQVKLYLH